MMLLNETQSTHFLKGTHAHLHMYMYTDFMNMKNINTKAVCIIDHTMELSVTYLGPSPVCEDVPCKGGSGLLLVPAGVEGL